MKTKQPNLLPLLLPAIVITILLYLVATGKVGPMLPKSVVTTGDVIGSPCTGDIIYPDKH